MTTLPKSDRLAPGSLDPAELDALLDTLNRSESPRLLGDGGGEGLLLPESLFRALKRALTLLKEGSAVVLMPEDETLTTQAAANRIGVSRQFLIGLLESGEIEFHKVGTHRRVMLKDLLEYEAKRSQEQKERIRKLSRDISEAGHYDDDFPTETR